MYFYTVTKNADNFRLHLVTQGNLYLIRISDRKVDVYYFWNVLVSD